MKSFNSQRNSPFVFFQEFLKHPRQIGSLIPSSRFLERRVLEAADVASARNIIELGSGTGGTTRAILSAMGQQARLLSIEVNPHFHRLLGLIEDDRLIAHLGSACMLKEIMEDYHMAAPEAIISGIPFSTISESEGSQIMGAISSVLAPKGRFVAYQLSNRVVSLGRPFLGPVQMMVELFNIPPLRVYKWEKAKNNKG